MGSVVEKIIGGIQSQYSRLDCTSRGGNLSKHTDLGFRSHRFCCESDPIGAYWGEGKPDPISHRGNILSTIHPELLYICAAAHR